MINILTPVGRIVEGSLSVGNTKNAEGQPLIGKDGQPRTNYYIGLAISKADPKWPALKAQIYEEARKAFPAHFGPNGEPYPTFGIKIIDGDSPIPNKKGTKPCEKEGFPGHWILKLSSGYAPKCFEKGGHQAKPAEDIKRGYYVRCAASVAGNDSTQNPGIYVNLQMVEFQAFGAEIVTGPAADEVFKEAAGYMPQGATQMPVEGTTVPPAAPGVPPAGVQPVPGFLNPPAPPAALPPAPPPAENFYLVSGQRYSESDLRKAGYADAHFATLQRA